MGKEASALAGSSASAKASAPPAPKLPLATRLAYGFGAVAYGVKENGFAYFLLIFYSQVIGVEHWRVGLAMSIALVFDAVIDVVAGYWSDNLRSRWGRRHPFMYASAVPVAATYYLLWSPPLGWGQEALFWYLLALAILIRGLISFYETPSAALTPELTGDYDQRSSLISWRLFFGWTGGNMMSVMMFMVLFPAFVTATIANGQFNRDAYAVYGLVTAALMFIAIVVSALGTHSRIPNLKAPPPKRALTPARIAREIIETLANRSFLALFVAGLFGGIAAGLSAALAFYIVTYFWGFSSLQIGILVLGVFVSAIIGPLLAPLVTRTIGKKRGAMIIGLIAFVGSPLPIFLKLVGLLPDGPSSFVFWFVFVTSVIDVGLIICFQVLAASMMADLAEQAELVTGRRSEGIFVAAVTFIRKIVTGLGALTATFILALVQFPAGADPSQVPAEAVRALGLHYAPTILALWLAMMASISAYRITRSDHEETLRRLAERSAAPST